MGNRFKGDRVLALMDTPKKLFAVIPAGKEEISSGLALETEQKHAWLVKPWISQKNLLPPFPKLL